MCTILRALRPLRACVRWVWGSEPFREAIGERSCLAANAGRGCPDTRQGATSHTPVPDWLMGMGARGSRGGVHSFGEWLMGWKSEAAEREPKRTAGRRAKGNYLRETDNAEAM